MLVLMLLVLPVRPGLAASEPILVPFELHYELLRNGREAGQTVIRLREEGGGRWLFETESRGTRGLASLAGFASLDRSQFELVDGALRSLSYRGLTRGAGRERERILEFDWQAGELIESGRGQGRWPLQGEVIDRHLALLALAVELEAGAAARSPWSRRVAWSGGISELRYAIGDGGSIEVPAGRYATVLAERIREDRRRQSRSWHAPELGHLPVRIEQRESDGEHIEMRLVRISRRS